MGGPYALGADPYRAKNAGGVMFEEPTAPDLAAANTQFLCCHQSQLQVPGRLGACRLTGTTQSRRPDSNRRPLHYEG